MSCWQILGIDPTADERAIRRAYAKKLKTTRPDEDPKGYQELREAFDNALSIAPFYAEEEEDENQESLFAEENQQDYFSADQESVADWNNEDLVPNFNQEGQSEQEQLFISEAELMASMPVQESQDWYSQPVESAQVEQVEDDYAEDEQHFGEKLYWEIDAFYREYGSEALLDNWEQISQEFSNLPLGEEDIFSWNLLCFLLDHEIDEPKLWFKCSEYFNWLGDYRTAANLNPESLLILEEQVSKGKVLIRAEKKLAKRKQNQPIDIHEIPPDVFPISQGIYYRLGSFWQNLIMYFYGFFLYQNLKEEMNHSWWENNGNKFRDFISNLSAFRAILLMIIIAFSAGISIYLGDPDNFVSFVKIYGFSLITFSLTLFFVFLICGMFFNFFMFLFPQDFIRVFNGIMENKTLHFLINIVLPILYYLLILNLGFAKSNFGLALSLFVIGFLCSSTFSYYIWGRVTINYYLFYFAFFIFCTYIALETNLFKTQEYFLYVLLFALVWKNLVMYFFHFYRNKFWILESYVAQPFKQVPYDWELVLFPFKLLRSAILWLFFTPFYSLQASISANIELGVITLFIIYISGKPLLTLFFFPIAMLVYAIYALIRNKLLRNLEVIK